MVSRRRFSPLSLGLVIYRDVHQHGHFGAQVVWRSAICRPPSEFARVHVVIKCSCQHLPRYRILVRSSMLTAFSGPRRSAPLQLFNLGSRGSSEPGSGCRSRASRWVRAARGEPISMISLCFLGVGEEIEDERRRKHQVLSLFDSVCLLFRGLCV